MKNSYEKETLCTCLLLINGGGGGELFLTPSSHSLHTSSLSPAKSATKNPTSLDSARDFASPVNLLSLTNLISLSSLAKLSISIICAASLAHTALQAKDVAIPPHNAKDFASELGSFSNRLDFLYSTVTENGVEGKEGQSVYNGLGGPWYMNNLGGTYGNTKHFAYASIAMVYRFDRGTNDLKETIYRLSDGARIDHLQFDYYRVSGTKYGSQRLVHFENYTTNLDIGTLDIKNDVQFLVQIGGTSTIETLNNSAIRTIINSIDNRTLTINTLNQLAVADGRTSEMVLDASNNGTITINTLNQQGGEVYHKEGSITTANITGGTYYQGYGPAQSYDSQGYDPNNKVLTAVGSGGSIGTANLLGGSFIQHNGTITNLNLHSGKFDHKGGTLTNIKLLDGNGTFINSSGTAIATISKEAGTHAIQGNITNFEHKGGTLTNITLKNGSSTFANSTNTAIAAITQEAGNHSTYGKIDKFTLKSGSLTNLGTITTLDVQGTASINSLANVGYNQDKKLSSIKITEGTGKLTVDTLDIGLKGNSAIQRVEINNSDNGGTNKEFAVNTMQISYIDGTFDPSKTISVNLKDYVTTGSQGYVDSNSKPIFTITPDLELSGVIGFQDNGAPVVDPKATLAASMTSIIVRQSMRQKMLIDTYLAEQSRRSLKNKERRTAQRIEEAALAEAKAAYEKDMAKYKIEKEKWDKRANTSGNQELIAKYESQYKAYQEALVKYENDKKQWDSIHGKNGALGSAPKAPLKPKAPTKPHVKPTHKDYKALMDSYAKADAQYRVALAQYQQDWAKYTQERARWDKEYQKLPQSAKSMRPPLKPKEPHKPAILAHKPSMPILLEINKETLERYASTHGVKGDFFLRPYGGIGDHTGENGLKTSSWSIGTLLGGNWSLKLGNTQGNVGFYGGYEYLYNGYKQAHVDAQGHMGFLGVRFSHLFARTKHAGFYYLADLNGGYADYFVGQDMNAMRYNADIGNVNFGSSIRLGSSIYMNGIKSMLFPAIGIGVDGGYLGKFEMSTKKEGELRYGGLSQGYAMSYVQASLNYYQEYGKRISSTLGGGFRYLLNNEVGVTPTINGKPYDVDVNTGKAAMLSIAPFFYQGTAMLNYHTDNAGNFSLGYVVVGGLLGITHSFSARWHYFF